MPHLFSDLVSHLVFCAVLRQGFAAWWLWRAVYLQKLPMLKKRLRVMFDWTIDLFFDRDITHIWGFKDDTKLAKVRAEA